jgi:hypothetical protein
MRRVKSIVSALGFKFYWPCFVERNKIVTFSVMIHYFSRKNLLGLRDVF